MTTKQCSSPNQLYPHYCVTRSTPRHGRCIHHVLNNEVYFSLEASTNRALGGLVAITVASGTVEMWSSVMIGFVAGIVYLGGSRLLIRLRIDDVVQGMLIFIQVNTFASRHSFRLFINVWSLIATGLFSSPSSIKATFGSDTRQWCRFPFSCNTREC